MCVCVAGARGRFLWLLYYLILLGTGPDLLLPAQGEEKGQSWRDKCSLVKTIVCVCVCVSVCVCIPMREKWAGRERETGVMSHNIILYLK